MHCNCISSDALMKVILLPEEHTVDSTLVVYGRNECEKFQDVQCVLMQQSVVDGDDMQEFLRQRIENTVVEQSENTGQHDSESERRKHVLDLVSLLNMTQMPVCIQIHKCQHVFSAIPLLYHFITGGFSCPLCRHGGGIALSHVVCPDNLNTELWQVLIQIQRLHDKMRQQVLDVNVYISHIIPEHLAASFIALLVMGNDTSEETYHQPFPEYRI